MASQNQTSTRSEEDDDFPIAAIICIAVGAYVIVIIVIIIIKQMLSSRGACKSDCCQGVEDGQRPPCCCTLCAKAGENCTCCAGCHINACLTKVCGKPKSTNCIDILLCNCGGCTEKCCTGCKCSCGCLKNIKCCTCCDSNSGSSFSCRNCCRDLCCCFDVPDSGACGCLCLEVKLRSPRRGSVQRRQSALPAKGDQVKEFSTHFPPVKNSDGQTLFIKTGIGGDFVLKEEALVRSNSNLKWRSVSLSPDKMKGSDQSPRNETASKKIFRNSSLSRNSPQNLNGSVKIGNHFNENDLTSKRINISANNDNEANAVKGSFRSSRQRKSLRVGRQSQRFPQHVLVSSDSLDSGSSKSDHKISKSRSMPVPGNVSKRPLPPLKNASQRTKLSKTN